MNPDDRLKILIVEDEPILAMELSDCLEEEGYDVVGTANNGRKALDIFKRQSVDLLLCDINIKGDWDGIQTVHQLTAERPVPVIYLTALTDRQTLERAKQTCPAAYVSKPYQLNSLQTAIELAIYNFTVRITATSTNIPATATSGRDPLGGEVIVRNNNYLIIKQSNQFIRINTNDLLYLEADSNYTTLYTNGRKYVLRLTLSGVLERINQPDLVRVHRSFAVNINKVELFNESEVKIGPQLIALSRGYRDEFLRYFLHQ